MAHAEYLYKLKIFILLNLQALSQSRTPVPRRSTDSIIPSSFHRHPHFILVFPPCPTFPHLFSIAFLLKMLKLNPFYLYRWLRNFAFLFYLTFIYFLSSFTSTTFSNFDDDSIQLAFTIVPCIHVPTTFSRAFLPPRSRFNCGKQDTPEKSCWKGVPYDFIWWSI